MHPFLLLLQPLPLIETPPKAADTADEAQAAAAGPAGPKAAVGEVRHAAAATHAKDILLPEDTDGTSGRLLLLDMVLVALLLFMLGLNEGGRAAFVGGGAGAMVHDRSGVGKRMRGAVFLFDVTFTGPDGDNIISIRVFATPSPFGSDLQDDVFGVETPLLARGHVWRRRSCSGDVALTFTG